MTSEPNRTDQLARAQEIKQRGESARRKDSATARQCYEEAVLLYRGVDEPLALAHTIRHLGDVYHEQGGPDLAEPCYHEALGLYRTHDKGSSLDLANAIRSLAVLRWEQTKNSMGGGQRPLHEFEHRGRNQGEHGSGVGSFNSLMRLCL